MVSCIYKMSLYQKTKQKCAKLVEEKKNRMFCCLSVRDFEQKILINCVHIYKFWKTNNRNRKLMFFLWEKVYLLLIKQNKTKPVYATVLILILYSIWVHIESPKHNMICLKSPKSIWFAILSPNHWLKILSYVNFSILIHYLISCF